MVTTFGGRAVALGVSAVAHVAVAVAAVSGGHATPPRVPVADTRELTLDVVDVPPPETAENVPARDPHDRDHAPAHTHTHPYPVDPDHDARPHDPSIVHRSHAPAPPVAVAPPAPESPPEPVAAAAEAAPNEPPRFTMAIGAVGPRAASAVTRPGGVGDGDASDHGDLGEILPAAAVSIAATCTGSAPAYTREAASAAIEADVPLEIVVDPRGHVRGAKVLSPAGYGLDASAIAGALAMRCTPAERAGHAVTVRMRWVTAFRLR